MQAVSAHRSDDPQAEGCGLLLEPRQVGPPFREVGLVGHHKPAPTGQALPNHAGSNAQRQRHMPLSESLALSENSAQEPDSKELRLVSMELTSQED